MNTPPRTADEPNDGTTTTARITDRAVLRYRQRINSREPFPRAKLIELFANATIRGDHPQVHNGIAWVAGDAILVTDSCAETVKTVIRRRGAR